MSFQLHIGLESLLRQSPKLFGSPSTGLYQVVELDESWFHASRQAALSIDGFVGPSRRVSRALPETPKGPSYDEAPI